MTNPFTKHPHSVGESYLQHMNFSQRFGFKLIIGGMAALIHSIFPFLFQTTASTNAIKSVRDFIERTKKPNDHIIELSKTIDKITKLKQ